MKASKQTRRDAKQLFKSCRVAGLLDENRARAAVQDVIAKKPRGYMAILSYFHRLVKLDVERRTGRVESATPLNEAFRASVAANLTRRYGGGLDISFAENPALIGGARVKVGSDVYDGSIKARLDGLAASF